MHHCARGRFYTVVDLVNRLENEACAGRQGQLADYLTRLDFVVLDELGYLPFTQTGGLLLFHLISRHYERGSMLITSNRSVGEWGTVFGDAVAATTILDRLLHHSHVLTIRGDSYQLREKRRTGLLRRRPPRRACTYRHDQELAQVGAQEPPAHRLREVSCLYGFTRFEAAPTSADGDLDDVRLAVHGAPLSLGANWLPAVEQFGEGLFIHFDEAAIAVWLARDHVRNRAAQLLAGFDLWKRQHPTELEYPGVPYTTLHGLSHALMAEIALECGYRRAR